MLIAVNEATAALRRIYFRAVQEFDGFTPVTNLTFSAGDIKLSKNGGAEANHAGTLSAHLGGGGYYYEATNGECDTQGFLAIRLVKADVVFDTRTRSLTVQIGPFGSTAAIALKSIAVVNSAGSALLLSSTGSNGAGLEVSGHGTAAGIKSTGGATGFGAELIGGGTSGHGLWIHAQGGDSHGLFVTAFGGGHGIQSSGGLTGHGASLTGGGTSGHGLLAAAPSSGDGIIATSAGGGQALGTAIRAVINAEVDTALSDINLDEIFRLSGNVNDGAATAGSFIGDAGLSALDDFYNGLVLVFTSGALRGVGRVIEDYVGATKTLSFANDFPAAPANGVTFVFSALEASVGSGGASAAAVADAVWDELRADHVAAGSFGQGVASVQGNVTGSVASVTGSVASIANNGITAGSFAAGSGAVVAAAVWDSLRASHVVAGSFGRSNQINRDGTATAGAAGTITLDGAASAVDDFYNNAILAIIGGTGVGQSRIISDYAGATKIATVNGNWVTTPDATSVFAISAFGSVPGATAPTAADVADAVWDEARSGHVAAGSFGEGVSSVQGSLTGSVGSVLGSVASVTALGAQAKTDVNTEVNSALVTNNLDHLLKVAVTGSDVIDNSVIAKLVSKNATADWDSFVNTTDSLEALRDQTFPSAAAIADQVWDELRADHTSAGTYGQGISSVQGNVVGNVTGSVASVTGAVGSVTGAVGSVTGNVGGNVTGSVGSVLGNVAGNIVGTVASVVGNVGGNVTGSVGSVAGNIQGNVLGSVGSLSAQARIEVNAEVIDVIRVDLLAELAQGQPPATPTLAQAVMFRYMEERNEAIATGSLKSIKNDAGTVVFKATLTDDGINTTKAKYVAGP